MITLHNPHAETGSVFNAEMLTMTTLHSAEQLADAIQADPSAYASQHKHIEEAAIALLRASRLACISKGATNGQY